MVNIGYRCKGRLMSRDELTRKAEEKVPGRFIKEYESDRSEGEECKERKG